MKSIFGRILTPEYLTNWQVSAFLLAHWCFSNFGFLFLVSLEVFFSGEHGARGHGNGTNGCGHGDLRYHQKFHNQLFYIPYMSGRGKTKDSATAIPRNSRRCTNNLIWIK